MIRTGMRRHQRHGKGGGGHGPLALVPMIDMLTILVVYLLVHTADMEILPNSKNITIPMSNSEQKPREATVVMVTRDMLYVNGEPVVTVDAGRRELCRRIRKTSDIPILMLTSVNRAMGLSIGKDEEMVPVDEFVEKPVDPAVLEAGGAPTLVA